MTIRFIEPRRDDPRLTQARRYKMVIGGRDVDAASGKTFKRESSVHPGLIVGEWPEASFEDVESAIVAARKAFDEGPWPRMSGKERAGHLYKISELIKQNVEELALMESLEVGEDPRRRARRDAALRRPLAICRRPGSRPRRHDPQRDRPERARPRAARTHWRRRHRHPVELPAGHWLRTDALGAGRRLHSGDQAQ